MRKLAFAVIFLWIFLCLQHVSFGQSYPSPVFSIVNLTNASRNPNFGVEDRYRTNISGAAPNANVFISLKHNGQDQGVTGPYGQTDAEGSWTVEGILDSTYTGNWQASAVVGSQNSPAIGTITFSVSVLPAPSVLTGTVTAVNRAVNGSFETADQNDSTLADSWQAYGIPYQRVHNFNVWDGNFIIAATAGQGAIQRVVLNQQEAFPVRISVRIRGENIVDDPADKLGASLDCKVAYEDGTYQYCPVTMKTKNVGTFDWKWVGYNTAEFGTSAKVAWIDVRLRMGNVSGTAYFDDVHVEEYGPLGSGLVTFCFHDSFLSTYTKGYPLLKAYGMVGTEAAVTSYLGSDAIHMTLAQLQDLQNGGKWSIISHTVTHRDLTTLDVNTLNDELYSSQKFLADNGIPTSHIAVPFGAYDGTVVSRIQAEWYGNLNYRSMQSMDEQLNYQGHFPYNVMVRPIISTTTPAQVSQWLQAAHDGQAWLVLVIHEIDRPNQQWTVSLDTLKQIVDLVSHSPLHVVTYDQGFEKITGEQ